MGNFWRTLEVPLFNFEINFILKWLSTCVITNSKSAGTFAITDTKLYVLVTALSTQDNAKLLEQLKSGFKRRIKWNNYQSNVSIERQNPYLDYLIGSCFRGVNKLFVLSIFFFLK